MVNHEIYMQRCLELAALGAGNVAPNPMVGCVIVLDNIIIGEGYHKKYGEHHAEVNAINSVLDKSNLSKATLYVNLEPCAHFGKTPPCADLILQYKIATVVLGSRDVNPLVAGKGIEKLKNNSVNIIENILVDECLLLNKRFFTFFQKTRPYVILKWAQTHDGFIGKSTTNNKPLAVAERQISNDFSNRLVHKMRSQEAAIMVGKNTVLADNPSLTVRHWKGKNPVRVIIDKQLTLNTNFKVFNTEAPTIIFNELKNETINHLQYIKINKNDSNTSHYLSLLYELKIQSIIIEGGSMLLQSFIDDNNWDEALVIQSATNWKEGVKAPILKNSILKKSCHLKADQLFYYQHNIN
jgi:diaminohydroxyphosphoribosylaminopyrimidine deaminase/5-amino-6-(5-phosphoribosylamino)uracil reductase